MNPYHQNPDSLTAEIRAEYKALNTPYLEPPPGFGCDFVTFNHRLAFVEVKRLGAENNLTKAERRLRYLASLVGIPYIIVTTKDGALVAAGYVIE